MIQLLRYQLSLHLRLGSTYALFALILIAVGLVSETPLGEIRPVAALSASSSFSIWVVLAFFLQLTSFFHFFFRPEAVQYRLARLRNRSMVIGGAMIHVFLLSILASLPFAVLYFGLLDDMRIAWLATMNATLFFVFLGVATTLVVRLIGTGTSTALVLVLILFVIPISMSSLTTLIPSLSNHSIFEAIGSLLQSHLDVFGNANTLILRGIQDTNALLRTLILTPILATITYVHFLRGDHH